MNIGICGPVNPKMLSAYLHRGQKIPDINKSANAVNTYIIELLRNGHHVIVVTSDVPGFKEDEVLKGDNILIHIVRSNPGLYVTSTLSRIYMIPRLKKALKLYVADMEVLHAQWTYDFALAAKSFEKELPVFCSVRDWCPYIMSIQKGFKKMQWFIYYLIFKKVMKSERIHFIANSEYTYNCIKRDYPNKDVSIIYNPIDKQYVLSEKKKKITSPTFISIAGDLAEGRKNIGTLIMAFAKFYINHKDSVLKLVGEDSGIRQKYDHNHLFDGVEFLGVMDHHALIDEIDNCTCLIHPSLEETFGNILIEGMARKVVVIGGKDSGAVPQVMGNGEFGILCDVTSEQSIVDAMEKACDHRVTDMYVERATTSLRDNYCSDIIEEQHLRLYKS